MTPTYILEVMGNENHFVSYNGGIPYHSYWDDQRSGRTLEELRVFGYEESDPLLKQPFAILVVNTPDAPFPYLELFYHSNADSEMLRDLIHKYKCCAEIVDTIDNIIRERQLRGLI